MYAGVSSAARLKLVGMLSKFSGTEMRCLPPLAHEVIRKNRPELTIEGVPLCFHCTEDLGGAEFSPLFFGTGAEYSPCGIFPCGKNPVQNPPPPRYFTTPSPEPVTMWQELGLVAMQDTASDGGHSNCSCSTECSCDGHQDELNIH